MKRIQKIVLIIGTLLLIWALVNPYLFTFWQSDVESKIAFEQKGYKLQTGNFEFKGSKLHYASLGHSGKPVLLFVHGSPGSWDFAWDYFMDSTWHQDYQLISIDRPGFGQSDYGQAKNLFEQSEIISAFVKNKLVGEKVTLLGHSYGGPLVLQLCADNDSLYERCIILAGSVCPTAEKEEWQLNLFSSPVLNWMAPGSFQQGILELLWLKDDLKKYESGLAKIQTPIMGIYGTDDNMVPCEPNVQYLKTQFDTSQLSIIKIDGGNHFIPWENYEEVKNRICSLK